MIKNIPFKKVVAYLGSSLLALTLFFGMPVLAESGSLSAPFVGFNVHIIDIDPEYKYIDGGSYYLEPGGSQAYIKGQLNCSNPSSAANSTNSCDVYELESQTGAQTGSFGGLNVEIKFPGYSATSSTNDTFTGTIYKRIYEVEFILDDSYVGSVTFQVGSVSYTSYVNGTSFHQNFWSDSAESFTITISDYSLSRNHYGSWNFPIESFGPIDYMMDFGWPIESMYESNYYTYPIFKLTGGNTTRVLRYNSVPADARILLICWSNRNFTQSNFTDFFDIGESFSVDQVNIISTMSSSYIRRIYIKNISDASTNLYINYKYSTDTLFFPIYFFREQTDYYRVSSDFALTYGIPNEFTYNLDIIANGTTSSNSSASQTNQQNSNLQDSQSDLFSQEDSFNDSMNNSLNNINTNFDVNTQFGSKFITSADWVKTQFDRMTGSTPFGSVLGFSLLLGIGLLIIGRVFG